MMMMPMMMIVSVELAAALTVAPAMGKIMAFRIADEMGDFAPKNVQNLKSKKINSHTRTEHLNCRLTKNKRSFFFLAINNFT